MTVYVRMQRDPTIEIVEREGVSILPVYGR